MSPRRHPFLFYAILFLGLTLVSAFVLWWLLKWNFLLAWFIPITIVTLVAYRYDKLIAGSDHTRVPERVLLLLTLAGGTLGAIVGMWFLGAHHKTSKSSFLFPFFAVLVVQAIVVGIYLWFQFGKQ